MEAEAPLDEPVTGKDAVISLQHMSVRSGRQTLTLVLDKPPKLVGIDPFNERIDRNCADNLADAVLEYEARSWQMPA